MADVQTSTWLTAVPLGLLVVGGIALSFTDIGRKFGDALVTSATNPEPDLMAANVMMTVIFIIMVLVASYFIITNTFALVTTDPRVSDSRVTAATNARVAALNTPAPKSTSGFTNYTGQLSLYGKLINDLAPSERYLANLCPLTASLGGYIGPVENGTFNPTYYIQTALKAGVRSFVLPISMYYDDNKMPPNWPKSRSPAIVCRNSAGKIISLNGLTVKTFCDTLVQYKGENAGQSNEPILIYLHAVDGYVPDEVEKEKDYVIFMSDIAKDLKSLDPYRLKTIGAYGAAIGGKAQTEILTQIPLTDLANTILIYTNFHINIATKDAYTSIRPSLYDYTNFTYTPISAATIGSTAAKGGKSIHISDIKGSQVDWASQARTTWFVTLLDDLLTTPNASLVGNAAATGINAIPLPLFFNDDAQVKEAYDLWQGYAWALKAPAARYAKPTPIVPQTPSTKLNARVDPNMQPGQLLVA